MNLLPPDLPPDVARLVDQKKFEELEALFTRKVDESPGDLTFFFALAAAVKKKGSGAKALSWLKLLADYQASAGDLAAWIRVLLEIARMSPTDAAVRTELTAALKQRYGSHPAFAPVLAQFSVEKAKDPSEVAGKIDRWLRFRVGDIYAMAGRGAGRIAEMNPALDVIRLEVGGARVPLSLVTAEKNLTPLPAGPLPAPEGRGAGGAAGALGEGTGRNGPPDARELRTGDDGAGGARSHGGPDRRAPLDRFLGVGATAPAAGRLGLRKVRARHLERERRRRRGIGAPRVRDGGIRSKRSRSRARTRSGRGTSRSSSPRGSPPRPCACGPTRPGLSWELSQAAARLVPDEPEAFPAAELVAGNDLAAVLADIRDQGARQSALSAIRAARPDWAEIFAARIPFEDDGRVLTALFETLGDRSADLSRRILRSPKTAPRAFVWLCERLLADGKAEPPALFFALLDALRQNEFSSLRARVKEFFDPGNLAVALVRAAASEDEGRDMLACARARGRPRGSPARPGQGSAADEVPGAAGAGAGVPVRHARGDRGAAPGAPALEVGRACPRTPRRCATAKEHGDLRENFEYHAARQKHEYLSARIATLSDELSRSRALDPARIEAADVRVGTRVVLRETGNGARARGDDPRPLGFAPGGVGLLLPVRVRAEPPRRAARRPDRAARRGGRDRLRSRPGAEAAPDRIPGLGGGGAGAEMRIA